MTSISYHADPSCRRAGRLDEAVALVKEFAVLYPPTALSTLKPMDDFSARSRRIQLVGAKPLVRLTTDVGIADNTVPPHFLFRDVEILHHRLVFKGRLKDVGYLKYICMTYSGALKSRRKASLGGEGHDRKRVAHPNLGFVQASD